MNWCAAVENDDTTRAPADVVDQSSSAAADDEEESDDDRLMLDPTITSEQPQQLRDAFSQTTTPPDDWPNSSWVQRQHGTRQILFIY